MNFKQLETFRAVMLTGSMTIAARQLHTSQPNVTRIIGKLEEEAGFALFDRFAGRIQPTKAGEAFFREVERSFIGLDSMAESARVIRDVGQGALRVAAAASIVMSALPIAIRLFHARHPRIRVIVDTGESSVVANWIATQHSDIGFVAYMPDKPGVITSLIHAENATCIVPSGHRLAGRSHLTPRDLEGERFISLPSGSASRIAVDAAFGAIQRTMVLETAYAVTICRMVNEGLGISLVNPIVSRTTKFPGIVSIPFKPDIPFKSYMLKPQLAQQDMHTDFFVDCMKEAFKATLDDQ
ncbi:LysR family transcriptional regulator [Advenella kashmirensis W13003]|uniref:LysR family transcriptional regulator n=1 Tax=Advenella kashmirensis W13003 TaxID=1424334 RepID=V8QVF4_9BURK|nr:LysR substrate-binding domain-containing protein [Advenella kashmirensis]ETF02979.1 LysR family transcriptional regulator [Advenella kashmirensis W13003]